MSVGKVPREDLLSYDDVTEDQVAEEGLVSNDGTELAERDLRR